MACTKRDEYDDQKIEQYKHPEYQFRDLPHLFIISFYYRCFLRHDIPLSDRVLLPPVNIVLLDVFFGHQFHRNGDVALHFLPFQKIIDRVGRLLPDL